ncbi:SixA phosphatase family protein [Aestuariibaculum suncheonense]|uniref:Histidine phosphatase family protein n=1 Tax=Aestuariibaculum suncheonense TaxID=1028745 RepID=A0A8J6UGE4_9FLAO|nr:histidine phosphatase family protein [Aestuariibaculum suncheonense]MBD0834989.1 histidine phosphatase family protein [Aestuariibaculum suncheonense]
MKKIIIIRHAKSSWEFNVIDHERPLNQRGINDANLLSKHLKIDTRSIDLILSSDSTRTTQTSKIFISNLNLIDKNLKYMYELYDFDGRDLTRVIKSCDNSVNTLMVFGHNHAVTDFVNTYGNQFIDNVPTSGVVIIEFNITDWKDLNKGKTVLTLFPRDLKND